MKRGMELDEISIHELHRQLGSLQRADLKQLSTEDVRRRVSRLIRWIPFRPRPLDIPGLFRTRIGAGFSSAHQLWYPPADIVGLGRLNDEGRSVFYAADFPNTAAFEARPQVGNTLTILEIRPKGSKRLTVNYLGITRAQDRDTRRIEDQLQAEDMAMRHMLGVSNYKKYALVEGWMTDQMTREISDQHRHLYKTTAGLADLLFQSSNDAIVYPSVAMDRIGSNICMLPEKVDALFVPFRAWELTVAGLHEGQWKKPAYELVSLRRTKRIGESWDLEWLEYGEDCSTDAFHRFGSGHSISFRD